MPCRVKICGITRTDDAIAAVQAGADAIGLVFYDPSPRAVTIDQAATIARSVGPFVTVVGLFVNPTEQLVRNTLEQVDLHVLQFHGDETEAFCQQFQRPYMKALRMRPELDVEVEMAKYPSASAILLDAYRKGVPGGTGESFDWTRVPKRSSRPIVLAGGLEPENVSLAVTTTGTYGVDVSGGVESAPGIKSAQLIESFIINARAG
ncbi:phosphoribosylanthranilate isomerase [Candidatus Pelagadaptatus aseana]|uniref:phosphoribosylanthranilate isomerase n=1 Tax=Candidatus Pelagadaptatus aseana TaxID=3120508 RepID=UPI003C6F8373